MPTLLSLTHWTICVKHLAMKCCWHLLWMTQKGWHQVPSVFSKSTLGKLLPALFTYFLWPKCLMSPSLHCENEMWDLTWLSANLLKPICLEIKMKTLNKGRTLSKSWSVACSLKIALCPFQLKCWALCDHFHVFNVTSEWPFITGSEVNQWGG